MESAVTVAIIGIFLSIISSSVFVGQRSGKDAKAIITLELGLSSLSTEVKQHNNDSDRHSSALLRVSQEKVWESQLRLQEQRLDSKFNEFLLRFDQCTKDIKAIDAKVDRALTATSSLSVELHIETGKLGQQIGELRARVDKNTLES